MNIIQWFSGSKVGEFIFFGNYFYALCVLSLSIEASLQQDIPLNSFAFYTLICAVTILYYTYAYMQEISLKIIFGNRKIRLTPPTTYSFYNKRTNWYHRNERLLNLTQLVFLITTIVCSLYLVLRKYENIFSLQASEWLILCSVPLVAALYYGNAFFPIFKINLRKSGWAKAFFIGFVWAGLVTLYPPMFYQWEHNLHYTFTLVTFWLLVKNWMYISVLAIMFDIKDYADDANRDLKTFVVRVGLRKTIFSILLPLTILGLISFSIFAYEVKFSAARYLINLIPFLLLLLVAYSMHQRKSILYYLVVIDGLMLLKSLCGIAATLLFV
ncbi:MAG: hypothetical protein JST36_01140 [Bacteroidetes bacterium]|nr:hypothetical protein [Bacteroidota bacterium]